MKSLAERTKRIAQARVILEAESEIKKQLKIPNNVEQFLFGKGMLAIQWIAVEPSLEGYEFLAEYIKLRISGLKKT